MVDVVKVGVGVIILNEGKVLVQKRINSHGSGTWSFPGGHMEFSENPEDTAKREVMEEMGVTIKNLKKVTYTNDFFKEENKHYITLFIQAELDVGTPKITEPDKCLEIKWANWEELSENLFLPIKNLLKQGFKPE